MHCNGAFDGNLPGAPWNGGHTGDLVMVVPDIECPKIFDYLLFANYSTHDYFGDAPVPTVVMKIRACVCYSSGTTGVLD